ncbi:MULTISPECIES: hypothetical protein [Streptomyces]|uniref:hypothetical protein n=1 Tax=Streptomyces TaxID=1883 RepID=UPI001675D517|nr:hypothetical protein [Streptomyces sp. FBKL.4005]
MSYPTAAKCPERSGPTAAHRSCSEAPAAWNSQVRWVTSGPIAAPQAWRLAPVPAHDP